MIKNCKEKPLNRRGVVRKLTKVEAEVLHLLTSEFYTIKRIAIRRGTSIQAVHYIIRNLRKKGYLNHENNSLTKEGGTFKGVKGKGERIRLHAQQFRINIIHKDQSYSNILNKGNKIVIDSNTVMLYKNSVIIHSNKDFWGESADHATDKSIRYWDQFITKLESYCKIILIKPGINNIKLVQAHYAEVHNELAKDCHLKAEKISIFTTEEGKLWFKIDNSFNMHEAETLHPETAQEDMQNKIQPFFNDIRDHEPVTLSQIKEILLIQSKNIQELTKQNLETAAGLSIMIQRSTPAPFPDQELSEVPNYIG